MRLAKAGYYGGNPSEVLSAPLDIVLQLIQYEIFENQLEKAYYELNKE